MGFFDNRLDKRAKFVFINQCFSIHGLALLVKERKHKDELRNSYQNIDKRLDEKEPDTEMFTRILMGLHYLKALNAIPEEKACIMSRSAIIDWYYGVYNAAQAMLYAQEKQAGLNHSKVIRQWYNSIVQNELALHPFDLSVDSLVKKRYEEKIENHPNYQKT
jgi:hypothetical protein